MQRRNTKLPVVVTRTKNRVRGAADKTPLVAELRRTAPKEVVEELARWGVRYFPSIGVMGQAIPRRPSEVLSLPPYEPIALQRELDWIVALIKGRRHEIQLYLNLKIEIDAAIFSDNLEEVLELIGRAEKLIGYSLQLTSLRISITQIALGLEAQKEISNDLRLHGASDVLLFYAFWWSVRAEDETTYAYFVSDLHQRVDSWDLTPGARSQIKYFLLNEVPPVGSEEDLLSDSTAAPLIDSYESLIAVAIAAVVQKRPTAHSFLAAAKALREIIDDERLTKILVLGGDIGEMEELPTANTAWRSFILGGELAPDVTELTVLGLEELYAASEAGADSLPTNPLLGRLAASLRDLSKPGAQGAAGYESLIKLGLMLGHSSVGRWAAAVAQAFAPRVEPYDPYLWGCRYVAASDALLESYPSVPPPLRASWSDVIANKYGSRPVSAASRLLSGVSAEADLEALLTHDAKAELTLWAAASSQDSQSILEASKALLAIGQRREAIFLSNDALLRLGEVDQALSVSVDLLVREPLYYNWLPLEKLIGTIYIDNKNLKPDRLETPLLFSIYTDLVNPEMASYRSYVSEDYVFANGVDRPSRLYVDSIEDPKRYAIRFLSDVCTQQTLKLFTAFITEKELEDERISICQVLAKLDPESRERYEDEARSIVTSRLVKEALKQLQASKISIDEDAIRAWAQRRLREDFSRYQSLYASGLVVVDDNYRNSLKEAIETGEFSQSLYDVPVNEASSLFIQIVSRLVGECAFNAEHGLDCYLSLRIRHGTMSGLLRSGAEKERVVTRRATETGDYRPNEFWRDAVAETFDDFTWGLFEDRLAKFSRDFDDAVAEITNDLIQIRREEKPSGLFDLTLNPLSIYGVATEVDDKTPFEELVGKAIDVFWALVELSLGGVRAYLDGPTRERFHALFNGLESDVRSEQGLAPLADAVLRARNEVNIAIDRVRDWFELPTPTVTLTFTLNELIEVALEATKSFHNDFQPDLKIPTFDVPPLQGALNLFADIFFVIFENIYTHSGSLSPEVSIEAVVGSTSLNVKVVNSITEERATAALADRVTRSRERIVSGAYLSDVSKEGGTGFPKLAKLVGYKSGRGSLDFALDLESRQFRLEFEVELTLRHKYEDEDADPAS